MVGPRREGDMLVQNSFAISTFFSEGKFMRIQMVIARLALNIVNTNDKLMVRRSVSGCLYFRFTAKNSTFISRISQL